MSKLGPRSLVYRAAMLVSGHLPRFSARRQHSPQTVSERIPAILNRPIHAANGTVKIQTTKAAQIAVWTHLIAANAKLGRCPGEPASLALRIGNLPASQYPTHRKTRAANDHTVWRQIESGKIRPMFHRSNLHTVALIAASCLAGGQLPLRAQDESTQHLRKYKAPPLSAHIEVLVVKDFNGKPISDAHVIFHPLEGDKDKGYLELKTDEDGKAVIDVLPIGDTVRMQIIATGYQTYGQDYKVDKTDMSMQIRMKRPGSQYSLYKDNNTTTPKSENGSGSSNSGSGKSSNPPQSSTPPASNDKSSGSQNPPQPQSN
jgi:hypothetical protein